MKQQFTLSILGAALIAFSLPASAQTSAVPADRATVKSEAAAANMARDKQVGEAAPRVKPTPKSGLTRAQVKADTKAAAASGELMLPGERSSPKPKKATVDKSRQQVKDETKVAKAKGELPRAGEIIAPTK